MADESSIKAVNTTGHLPMRAPVLLIIFNRPDTTRLVLEALAQVKPPRLFVFGDGPRADRPDDKAKCTAARAVIKRLVTWDCELVEYYSEANLGCGRGPATAISWVFEQVDRAIILEDDCLPHPTFFPFCDALLETYADDTRVMHIAGQNLLGGARQTSDSYFFSNYCVSWGWATWKRAWRHHDLTVRNWPALRDTSWLEGILGHPDVVAFYKKAFAEAYSRQGDIHYWDYQWAFACWSQKGLSILPTVNVVFNIGFGHPDATHTTKASIPGAATSAEEMVFPLRHPSCVRRNQEADRNIVMKALLPSLPKRRGHIDKVLAPVRSFLNDRPSLTDPTLLRQKVSRSVRTIFRRHTPS
mgnify:CR=1 FL=1